MTGVAPPFVLSTETTTLSTSSYPGYPLILVFCQSKNQIRMVTGKPLALPTLVYSAYIFPFKFSYGTKERIFDHLDVSASFHHEEHAFAYLSAFWQK